MSFACLFEAKSIQDYILRSGRLRHLVGASELVDSLTRDLLDEVLAALGGPPVRFSRRAGGAVYLFADDPETRDAFRDLWTLAVRCYAPGLSFVIANGEGADDYAAYGAAKDALQAARNRPAAALPAGTPVTRYAPRTGLPATQRHKRFGFQDEASQRFGLKRFCKRTDKGLIQRFDSDSWAEEWPNLLAPERDEPEGERSIVFPFLPDNRYLGLIHADGNGLGQLLMDLGEYAKRRPAIFTELFSAVSEAIQRATEQAAQESTAAILKPHRARKEDGSLGPYPARPIVLGGDDLTILVRADLALPFAQRFMESFERASHDQMRLLQAKYPEITVIPECLTAGAGIAFIKSNHPFYLAHELTEALAKFAKDRAKSKRAAQGRIPPTLAFHRITTATHGDYEGIRQQELTYGDGRDRICTSLGAYGIDPQPKDLPALADLIQFAELFRRESVARGPARQLLTLIGQDLDEARRRYTRWREVMGERDPQTLQAIDELLTRLCGTLAKDLPVSQQPDESQGERIKLTPFADLLTLLAIGRPEPLATQNDLETAA